MYVLKRGLLVVAKNQSHALDVTDLLFIKHTATVVYIIAVATHVARFCLKL
jgi:hypothetical protein